MYVSVTGSPYDHSDKQIGFAGPNDGLDVYTGR